ncbi:MAG TPA: diguanylate cyclase [Anaeromyxobacteraceae bacterium]|nr:diguanylate cyclase [Anaeromyxobacteraceae bacterium]
MSEDDLRPEQSPDETVRRQDATGAPDSPDLLEAHRKLRDSARRREDLLSDVARDLRGPVGSLRAEIRRLLTGAHGTLEEAQRRALEKVERHAIALADLSQDLGELQDLTRGRAELQRAPLDLARLVAEIGAALEPVAAEQHVMLSMDTPEYPVLVNADASRLRPALEDLFAGALARSAPGAVNVRVGAFPGGARLEVDSANDDGRRTARPPRALAAALLRELVELHGGTFEGGGSHVSLTLPAPATHSAVRGSLGHDPSRPRVLVVEDDEGAREALADVLSDFYEVETTRDGVEGVDAARLQRPDLILMDLFMPRLDGFGALEALRADPTTSDVPVILVSGRGDDLTRAHSLDLGAIDFLQKPFSERELRARIDRTLRLARRQSQLQVLAETDSLTGLANRRAFHGRLALEVKRARRYGTPLACLMVDMDHLKPINDLLGHAAGDRAIATIAELLRGELRETDFGARYGGDEFVLLLPHTTAAEGRVLAARLCDRIRDTTLQVDGQPVALAASFGVSELPDGPPEQAGEEMLRMADAALYEAKAAGRGRVAVQLMDEDGTGAQPQ